MTIAEFFLARIAEDEARWVRPRYSLAATQRDSYEAPHWPTCDYPGDMTGYCDCQMLVRTLAEVEAKKRLVRFIADLESYADRDGALRTLAAVYADHPDYRSEWAP